MIDKPTILLCPPDYFRVESTINIWMKKTNAPVNLTRAKEQWTALHHNLEKIVAIEIIEAQATLPDMVFTANAGFIYKNKVILSKFLHPERKEEAHYFKEKFLSLNYEVYEVPAPYHFEGCGDALYDEYYNVMWAGYGFRSDKETYGFIEECMDISTISMQLTQEAFYHLDTCFCPLANGYVLYYPKALTNEALSNLETIVPIEKRIPISEEDAFSFVCNTISINTHVILNKASSKLVQMIEERDMHVIQNPLDEFLKAGGSAKCLSLRLDVPSIE